MLQGNPRSPMTSRTEDMQMTRAVDNLYRLGNAPVAWGGIWFRSMVRHLLGERHAESVEWPATRVGILTTIFKSFVTFWILLLLVTPLTAYESARRAVRPDKGQAGHPEQAGIKQGLSDSFELLALALLSLTFSCLIGPLVLAMSMPPAAVAWLLDAAATRGRGRASTSE